MIQLCIQYVLVSLVFIYRHHHSPGLQGVGIVRRNPAQDNEQTPPRVSLEQISQLLLREQPPIQDQLLVDQRHQSADTGKFVTFK